MLSRAATSLTLLGRHLERADHLARILGVHVALSLDRADEPGPDFWVRFMELAGWHASDTGKREQAVEMLVAGTLGPSVRASIAAARLAAQAVRPSLPSELYEQVNALHWRVQEAVWQPDLYQFLMDVQMSIRLVDGLLEDTMFHDEARDFVRLGKFIERAANVTHVVTQKSAELADSPEDALEWTAVLKSCFAFESYQSRYPGGVTPDRVIECLLLDRSLPRSARFPTNTALETVMEVRLRPMDGNGQRCLDFKLELSHGVKARAYVDGFGNHVHYFNLVRPHSGLSVISRSTVETGLDPDAEPGEELVQDFLRFRSPVKEVDGVVELARRHEIADRASPESVEHALDEVALTISREFTYDRTVTNVYSSVDEVLELRAGVCQDFAHLFIAASRTMGVPARYVSGYIHSPGEM